MAPSRNIIHRVEGITEFVRLKEKGTEQVRRAEAEVFLRANEVAQASADLKTANAELERLYARSLQSFPKSQDFSNATLPMCHRRAGGWIFTTGFGSA